MPGYDQYLCWGIETVWGTEVARTKFAKVYEDTQLMHERPQQGHEFLGNRDPDFIFDQIQKGTGNLVIPMTYDAGPEQLLQAAMGVLVTTGSGPYVHTFTLDNNPYTRAAAPLIGLSVENHLALPDASFESMLGVGGRVRSMSGSFVTNEELKLVLDMVFKRCDLEPVTGTPVFPAYSGVASSLVKFTQITVDIDTVTTPVYSCEFSLNNNLKDDNAELGSAYIRAPRAQGRREITGSLSKEWVNKTLYDKWIAGAAASILVTASGPALPTGPGNFVMTWRFENVRFTGENPKNAETEEQENVLPFTAYDDPTFGAMQVVITNDTEFPLAA
ncbi:MAG: phage tail tube protein [Dehalococcoidia bacterium]